VDTADVIATTGQPNELTGPERQVVRAAGTGALVDLRTGTSKLDDPAEGGSWDAARTVRAEVLVELLTGTRDPAAGRVRAVKLCGARITGRLDLEAAALGCPLLLQDCHLEQLIDLSEARAPVIRLPGCHVPGLAAAQLETRGNLELDKGFTATGEVSLLGAHIGGQLNFEGASLTNPDGPALTAHQLAADQGVFCQEGFTATGEVRLVGAHIGGQLSFSGASLTNPDGLALDLAGVRAAELFLLPRQRPDGVVDLTNARVGSFHDDQATWPDKNTLGLGGFVYETLENDQVSVRDRIGWVRRYPGGYTPQPYEQLAAAYRRAGHDEAARQVAVAKQWHRRSALRLPGKLWNWLLYLTVGYGYRTWLAALWLAGLLVAGTRVFARAYLAHQMVAAKQPAPVFSPVVYTLDRLVPIVNLGQRDAWIPQGAALRWSWVLTGAGWVLTTAVVAGLTGILKRD
jgi:hypothetical protein